MAGEPPKNLFGGTPQTTSSGTPSLFASGSLFGSSTGGFGSGSQPTFGAKTSGGAGTGGTSALNTGSGGFDFTKGFGQGGTSTPGKTNAGSALGGGSTVKAFDFGNPNPASSTGGAPTPPNASAKPSTTPAGPPPVNFFANKTAPSNPFASIGQASNPPAASAPSQPAALNMNAFGANKVNTRLIHHFTQLTFRLSLRPPLKLPSLSFQVLAQVLLNLRPLAVLLDLVSPLRVHNQPLQHSQRRSQHRPSRPLLT